MNKFDDIRPYCDEEVVSTIDRLLNDSHLKRIARIMLPHKKWEEVETLMKSFRTVKEFQHELIIKTVCDITGKTADSVSCSGVENLHLPHVFISNHRDIILDASILCSLLIDEGYETVEIAIGDNLLMLPWIEDMVRLNRSFIVRRTPDFHQMLEVATHLSKYIHFAIKEKKASIWIAQREGRSKDSNDQTQEAILKMLIKDDNVHFVESISELNIVPLTLSYEYDPCDFLKAKEFQQKRDNPEFKKSQEDDFVNMEIGLFGYRGNIHFRFGRPINSLFQRTNTQQSKNELISESTSLIDREIHLNYRLFPINYIAYDRLWGDNCFMEKYTDNDIKIFDAYLNQQLGKINLKNKDIPFLTKKILEIYAYPLKNHIAAKE